MIGLKSIASIFSNISPEKNIFNFVSPNTETLVTEPINDQQTFCISQTNTDQITITFPENTIHISDTLIANNTSVTQTVAVKYIIY